MRAVTSAAELLDLEINVDVNGTDLSGRVKSLSLLSHFDAGAWSLDLVFDNNAPEWIDAGANLGLGPNDPNSAYNAGGVPLLGAYHPVTFKLRKTGVGTWTTMFEGFIGPGPRDEGEDWGAADEVNVTCVSNSQPLKDAMIEKRLARRYVNAVISSIGAPCLLNRIIQDKFGAGTSYAVKYIANPDKSVSEYVVSNVSVWAALENALAPTGYRLIERWHAGSGAFFPCVMDPQRSKVVPDITYSGDFDRRRISGSESDVRTYVAVVYGDADEHEEKYVYDEASDAIKAKYGIPDGAGGRLHKIMVYRTQERSLVDSESEARALAADIRHDVQEPTPDCAIHIPFWDPRFEPFDLFRAVGENYTTDLGVMEVRWSWSFSNPLGETELTGTVGKIIGAKDLWLSRDVKRKGVDMKDRIDDLSSRIPSQPSSPQLDGAWYIGEDGTPQPVIDVTYHGAVPWWVKERILSVTTFTKMDSGTATSSGDNYLDDSGKAWTVGNFSGGSRDWIFITAGTGAGQERKIKENTATRITVQLDWDTNPDVTSTYVILRQDRNPSEEYSDVGPYHRLRGWQEGRYVGVKVAHRPAGR